MGGISIIIVGATGTGKTTEVKSRISNVNPANLMIYDVNNEYQDFYNKPFGDFKDFAAEARAATNKVIVFEEATIFLNNRSRDNQLVDILVRKRHTNNMIFLNFHSFRTIPRYIYDLSNYIILFKTNDSVELIEKKYEDERLTKLFLYNQQSEDKHVKSELKIY